MKDYKLLFEKHKQLFTGDGFGFECKTGWYGILDGLMAAIGLHLKQCLNPGF